MLIATLGKAIGVNGGYVASSSTAIRFLREKAATYIYSNPISPSEAAAALAALEILDSGVGARLLAHLRAMTDRFARGIKALGLETLVSGHPIVPLLVRDAARTAALARRLKEEGVLATAINYPVVPRGEEEIRFQVSADHTPADIDEALAAIKRAILSV